MRRIKKRSVAVGFVARNGDRAELFTRTQVAEKWALPRLKYFWRAQVAQIALHLSWAQLYPQPVFAPLPHRGRAGKFLAMAQPPDHFEHDVLRPVALRLRAGRAPPITRRICKSRRRRAYRTGRSRRTYCACTRRSGIALKTLRTCRPDQACRTLRTRRSGRASRTSCVSAVVELVQFATAHTKIPRLLRVRVRVPPWYRF